MLRDDNPDIPDGVGIVFQETKKTAKAQRSRSYLIDPMTKETISKVAQLDADGNEKTDRTGKVVYNVNDHWFKLDFKLAWKDAPKPPVKMMPKRFNRES